MFSTIIILFSFISLSKTLEPLDMGTLANMLIVNETCQPSNTFNYSEISSTTIPSFPSESAGVCGDIVINEHLDVSSFELLQTFATLDLFIGDLTVENSNLSSLSIFAQAGGEYYVRMICNEGGISIINNTELVDISGIFPILATTLTNQECLVRVLNNPKLDASALCDQKFYKYVIDIEVKGNLKDCGCQGGVITSENIKSLGNCTKIFGGLDLSLPNSTVADLQFLRKIQSVRGNFEIHNSNFQNLSFLESFHEITSRCNITCRKTSLNIHDNFQMTRFGLNLNVLENMVNGYLRINFENLHPDFCITFSEMAIVLGSNLIVKNFQAKYCEDSSNIPMLEKLCKFTNMSSLESSCTWIHGDIIIDSGDEVYLSKLQKINVIFGTLNIKNTNITEISFLPALRSILSLSENLPVLSVTNNTNLMAVEFPSMKFIRSRDDSNTMIFNGNHNALFNTTEECVQMEYKVRGNLTVEGGTCDQIYKKNGGISEEGDGNFSKNHGFWGIVLFVIIILYCVSQ